MTRETGLFFFFFTKRIFSRVIDSTCKTSCSLPGLSEQRWTQAHRLSQWRHAPGSLSLREKKVADWLSLPVRVQSDAKSLNTVPKRTCCEICLNPNYTLDWNLNNWGCQLEPFALTHGLIIFHLWNPGFEVEVKRKQPGQKPGRGFPGWFLVFLGQAEDFFFTPGGMLNLYRVAFRVIE